MPVVTRSQSKALNQLNHKPVIKNKELELDNKKLDKRLNYFISKNYFIKMMKSKLSEIKLATNDFDKYRMMTEMFYTVREWFDVVFNIKSRSWKGYIDSIYIKANKILLFAQQKDTTNFTYEEYYIWKTMINEMIETRKFIIIKRL